MPNSRRWAANVPHERSTKTRWDVQGLRAFAVIVVVLDHLWAWPRGGFVGVDMFFVISGFLITGLLVREHDRTDHISFLGFYRRRIRRIIPAAILVLVFTVAVASTVFGTARYEQTRTDAIWALFFGANVRMENLATDYFANAAPSPVQHYWSLSIEEQFYFVWPWLMLLIFAVLARRAGKRAQRSVAFATIAAVSLASFAWALHQSTAAPSSAYFSTFTRIWELGAGAMLALAVPVLHRIPDAVRPAVAWVGLGGMVASLFVISEDSTFPAPGALLPVASIALVIAAGTFADHTRQQRFLFPLTNRVSEYVGDISYSMYLWHWPLIIFGLTYFDDTVTTKVALLVVIAVVSVCSYNLVEHPIHKSRWLDPGHFGDWTHSLRKHGFQWPETSTRWQLSGIAAMLLLTGVFYGVSEKKADPPESALAALGGANTQRELDEAQQQDVPVEQQKLRTDLTAALNSASWPTNLKPSMDAAVGSPSVTDEGEACGDYDADIDAAKCTWGPNNATKKAVLVGDSIAMGYLSSLTGVFEDRKNWSLTSVGTFDCAFMAVEIDTSTESHKQCRDRKSQAVAAINEIKPDVLFVSSIYSLGFPLGSDQRQTSGEYRAAVQAELDKVDVGRVVFLAAPPADKDPSECYTPQSSPADCTGGIPPLWKEKAAADKALADANQGIWIDTSDWYCVANLCPPFAGTTPMKVDYAHLTLAYQAKIVPVMSETFARLGVLSPA